MLITSNLVFSQWDRIFKDAITTAAAIDRLVHHSVIIELVAKRSFRADEAHDRSGSADDNYDRALARHDAQEAAP